MVARPGWGPRPAIADLGAERLEPRMAMDTRDDPDRPDPSARRLAWGGAAAALFVAVLASLALQPGVVGLFHDDGIYVSVARGLAEGHGYRLVGLPGDPWQTKYPFLYPGALAAIWKLWPDFPANLLVMKLLGVAALSASVWLATRWYGRRFGRDGFGVVFGLMVGAGATVLPYTNFTLTELPFLAACLLAFAIADPVTPVGEAPRTPDRRLAIGLGLVVGAALLLRMAAAPLALGGLALFLRGRRARPLVWYAGVVGAFVLPWLAFKTMAPDAPGNPLLAYYTEYEPSVVELALRDGPGDALGIVADNLWYVGWALDQALLLPLAPWLRIPVYPLVLLGLARAARRPIGLAHGFVVLYLALIVSWPFHPARYALPLLPLMPLGLVLGVRELWRIINRSPRVADRRSTLRTLAIAPLILVLLLFTGWNLAFQNRSSGNLRFWAWGEMRYGWDGFEETFAWIRDHTPPDAVLGTAYDPMYHLYTDRDAVRPWFHRPWTYFYPREGAVARLGPPEDVQAALEELGVDYLVIDPLGGYAEEDGAADLFEALLEAYDGPEFPAAPVLRFVSSDSLHRVYELPRRSPETSPPGGS